MSKYTAELRTIIAIGFDIFDFEYSRSEEAKSILSNENLQQGFIDRYFFREVGFETLERFKHHLKTQWRESIAIFDKLLIAYNNKVEIKSNMSTFTKNKSVYNDTPTSSLGNEDYATSITDNNQYVKGNAGITEIELLELYHDKIKDIQSEFYDSFDNLFMQIF